MAPRRGAGDRAARDAAARRGLLRRAPARDERHRAAAPDPRVRSLDPRHHHDRLRHHRGRGRGGEARRVRLPEEAGGPGGAEAPGRPRPGELAAAAGALLLPAPGGAATCPSPACSASPRRCARCWTRPGRSRRWTRPRPSSSSGRPGPARGWSPAPSTPAAARAAKPFIEVNCTALPATLMEAELFGHERGAFTDAKESRMGLFEAAEGGFLFLDEVGDVELSLQGKLLKAVEERTRATGRRDPGPEDRRPDPGRHQPRPGARVPAGALPARPLLPPGGDPAAPAAAPGAGRGRADPGRAFLRRFSAKYGKHGASGSIRGPATCCSPTPGPGTCGS